MTTPAIARQLGPVGVWSRELRYHPDRAAIADAAAELEQLGFGAVFIPDVGGDVLDAVERVLDATSRLTVATGILNIWMHDAAAVTDGWHALERRHPGRFALGLGASHAAVVDAEAPGRYARPLSRMRDYLDALDAAPRPIPPERRMLAALGPRMLELARDRAGGAHPYLVPVSHTRSARELLGPDRALAPELPVVLEADPAQARALARRHLALYLGLPNYVRNLLRCGFAEHELRDGGSDRLVDALVAWGDEAAIARRVTEHREAGADHVCVQVVEPDDAVLPRAQWRRLAAALC